MQYKPKAILSRPLKLAFAIARNCVRVIFQGQETCPLLSRRTWWGRWNFQHNIFHVLLNKPYDMINLITIDKIRACFNAPEMRKIVFLIQQQEIAWNFQRFSWLLSHLRNFLEYLFQGETSSSVLDEIRQNGTFHRLAENFSKYTGVCLVLLISVMSVQMEWSAHAGSLSRSRRKSSFFRQKNR